MEFLYTAGQYK